MCSAGDRARTVPRRRHAGRGRCTPRPGGPESEGDPKLPPSQDIPDLPNAKIAEVRGIRVERPVEVGPALDEALSADRPVLIDAVTDPTGPTLPPELKPAHLEKIEQALSQGDPDADMVRKRLEQEGHLAGQR